MFRNLTHMFCVEMFWLLTYSFVALTSENVTGELAVL